MKLLLDCRALPKLLSESQDSPPPLVMGVRMRLHLLTCKGCRRVGDQLVFMRKAVRDMQPGPDA